MIPTSLTVKIALTRAELQSETLKPRARRRIELETRLKWLVLQQIKSEIRAGKRTA